MAATKQYNEKEVLMLVKIARIPKADEILRTLRGGKQLYFNQICEQVKGSKTTIVNALRLLASMGILKDEWTVQTLGQVKTNPRRAVRKYQIAEEYSVFVDRLPALHAT